MEQVLMQIKDPLNKKINHSCDFQEMAMKAKLGGYHSVRNFQAENLTEVS